MKTKRLIPVLLVLAAAGGIVYYRMLGRQRSVVLTGIVTTHDVMVSSEIQGRLAQLRVKEGDTVRRGELLAVIEPEELRADEKFYAHTEQSAAAQVAEAQAALRYQELQTREQIREAEATLASLQAQQAQAAADLERARLDFERAESLFKQGIDSQQAYDQARTTCDGQKAHFDALGKQVEAQRAAVALAHSNAEQVAMRQSQLRAGRFQWAAAQAQKEKSKVRLDYSQIIAPLDGVVAVCSARLGEVVNPAQPIVDLIDPDDLWVRADVEETYIDSIRLGDRFPVRLPSGAERTGTVFYRGVDANYATQRDVSRTKRDIKTFEVRLRVENSDRRLYPGMTAFVTVPLQPPQ